MGCIFLDFVFPHSYVQSIRLRLMFYMFSVRTFITRDKSRLMEIRRNDMLLARLR